MKWRLSHQHRSGQALVEMALVLPLLILLLIGGMSLFVRGLYRDSLDEAAEQAAWAAARSGGDQAAVQQAVERAIPFVSLSDLSVSASSTGYHTEVAVSVAYHGSAITSLPFFNGPLLPAQASATNQQEAVFTFQLGTPAAPAQLAAPEDTEPGSFGPAAWPSGPAAGDR